MKRRVAIVMAALVALVALALLFNRRAGNGERAVAAVRAGPETKSMQGTAVPPPARSDLPAVSSPRRYELFSRQLQVLQQREGSPNAAGERERVWLLDGGTELGRLRVSERVRRGPADPIETVLLREAFVAGEVIVTPKKGASPAAFAAALSAAGAVSWKPVPGSSLWVARFPEPDLDTLPRALAALAQLGEVVQAVEGNGVGAGGAVPNDAQFGNQFALRNTGQFAGVAGADIRMTTAWDRVTSSPAVIVAVLDSGLDLTHPDLVDNAYRDSVEIAGNGIDEDGNGFIDDFRGWDFANNDNDPTDDHDHGSHVAGTIGARGNNGTGIAGVTWNVRLLPVKILNSSNVGLTTNMIAGVHYARGKGARVMNLSLAGFPFSSAMAEAVQAAENAGILLVISAGNLGTNNDVTPNYPSSHTNSNIIAVANTTNTDILNAGFNPSNYGATRVHLAAPGSNILSTVRVSNGSYSYFYGTSMAAPHVTGVAALLLALRPNATPADMKRWILDSADRLPSLTGRCVTGGRLNAAAALQLAADLPAFTTTPQAQTASAGGSVTFTVAATGSAPLSYQWFWNEITIVGATSSNYVIAGVQPSHGGNYKVTVTNSYGSQTTAAVALTVNGMPAIATHPAARAVSTGQATTFTVTATGSPAPTYQWLLNGSVIPGATSTSYTIPSVASTHAGSYAVTVTNAIGSVASPPAALVVNVPNPARLINLSILTRVDAAGEFFTLGYVVGGANTTGNKPLVIRAAGPSLGALGVPGILGDPKLELYAGATKTNENDNWGGSTGVSTAMAAVGAFPFTGGASLDAAVLVSITTRDNSVKVSAANTGTGTVIAEIYDATLAANFTVATPRLINVSVLKPLGTGLTAGFVIGGAGSKSVLIRAIGPTLGTAFGLGGVVGDPQLTLFGAGGVRIGANDNWGGTAALTSAFTAVGAFVLPAGSRDAALLATLAPGDYTVEVKGVANTTGLALVEVYDVP